LPYDEDLLSQLENQALNVVNFDEIKPSVEKAVNALYPKESRADIMRMYEIKNEIQKKINSLPFGMQTLQTKSIVPGAGFAPPMPGDLEGVKKREKELEKILNSDLYKELLDLNSKYAPKGKKTPTKLSASELGLGLYGPAGQALTPQLTATPEAIAEFQNKLKTARENTPDIVVGAGSGEMQTEKIIFDRVFEQTVKEDPFIKAKLYELKIAARPLLKEKRKELAKKYNLENQDDYNRATAELNEYSKFLIQDKLYSSNEFKERFRELSVVASSGQIDILKQQGRENDPFFKAMDELRNYGQAGKMVANVEFLAKGFKRVQENFNGIQLSLAVGNTASYKKKKQALEKGIESGEIGLEDRFVESSFWKNLWGTNKAMNVKELLDYYADEIEKNKQDIIIQLEDLDAIGDELMLYNEVDEDDLWLTRTTGHLMESTPYMIAALAGTGASMIPGVAPAVATAVTTLGTGFMMLDFYGAQWYSTFLEGAEAEAKRKGINLEQIPEQEKRDFLIQALESGKYDAKAEAAAAGVLMGLTEKFGLSKSFAATSKALGLGTKGMFSLIRGEWKQVGKKFIRSGLSFGESYLSEFSTELSQTGIDQAQRSFSLGVNKMNFKEMWEAGTIGGNVALLMPGAAAVGTQTSVEIRNAARKLAINFAPKSNFATSSLAVNNWFKMANQELDKRFDNGKNPEYNKEQYEADKNALATTYNSRLKIPSNATPEVRAQLLDLMSQKNALEMEINKIDDKDLASPQILELAIVKGQIQSLVKQEANIKTLTTSKARQAAIKVAEQRN